jgi:uncharacterized protein (DUF305 family)
MGEMDTSEPTDPSPPGSVAADEPVAAPAEAARAPAPDGGDDAPHPGLTWGKVAVLGLALMFLGFSIGFVVTRDRPPASDSADVGFLQDMITHHDQALGVATLTVAYGDDPTVRSYAMEVLTFQSYEIGVMTQTLAGWGLTRDDRSDEAMAWMDMGVPVEQMPGLLSEEDLDRVGDARGAEIDSLFLELMAEHHRGGIHMAQEAAARVDDDAVAELAARMERNQAGEINEYRVTAETLGLDLEIEPAEVPPADLPPSGD